MYAEYPPGTPEKLFKELKGQAEWRYWTDG